MKNFIKTALFIIFLIIAPGLIENGLDWLSKIMIPEILLFIIIGLFMITFVAVPYICMKEGE